MLPERQILKSLIKSLNLREELCEKYFSLESSKIEKKYISELLETIEWLCKLHEINLKEENNES